MKKFYLLLFCFLFLPCVCAQDLNEVQEKSDLEEITQEETESSEAKSEELEEVEDTKEVKEGDVLKGHVSKVPGGTKLRIIVETPIDEVSNKVDDEFTARIAKDIVIDGKTVVPIGSIVNGKITEINPSKRLHKAGSVRIEFKNLTTPDGRQIPIVASVLTRSGLLKGRYTGKKILAATATLIGPAAAGLGAGLAAEGSAVGAGIGATLGAIAGIALFAFQKGNPVDIKAGEELNIELTEDLLVPEEGAEVYKKEEEIGKGEEEGEKIQEKDFTEGEIIDEAKETNPSNTQVDGQDKKIETEKEPLEEDKTLKD